MFAQGSLPLLLILAAPAPPLPTMQWKFREGDVFYVRNVTTVDQKIVVLGNAVEQKQETTVTQKFTVRKVARDEVRLDVAVEDASVKMTVGGGAPQEMGKHLRGASFALTLNGRREIAGFEGFQAFLEKIPEKDKAVLSLFLSEDQFKHSLGEFFVVFPAKGLSKGDTWDRTTRQHMGPVGSFEQKNRYRYEGKEKIGEALLDRATWTSEMRYTLPAPAAQGQQQLPFQIKKADLKAEEFSGTLHFDSAAGRLRGLTMSFRLKGKMSIEIGGMETEMEMDQQARMKSTVLPRLP